MPSASGKFMLRAGTDLHARLKREARENATSLNAWVVRKLSTPSEQSLLLQTIHDAFNGAVTGVILFGSEARCERKASSDIDLLIVLEAKLPIDRSLYSTWATDVADAVDVRYSPHFSHLPEVSAPSSLWLEVSLAGQVLYDDIRNTTRRRLTAIRDHIAEGRYVRKTSHGHPYWTRR